MFSLGFVTSPTSRGSLAPFPPVVTVQDASPKLHNATPPTAGPLHPGMAASPALASAAPELLLHNARGAAAAAAVGGDPRTRPRMPAADPVANCSVAKGAATVPAALGLSSGGGGQAPLRLGPDGRLRFPTRNPRIVVCLRPPSASGV